MGMNSDKTCRQAPQGTSVVCGVEPLSFASNARATNLRSPSWIALKTATLSAQIDNPYEAFSTLDPVYIFPLEA